MLNVQKYLLGFNNRNLALSELNNNYGISVGEYDKDLIVLNYDQIKSPRFHNLVDDCRGLILSWDFTKIYSRPFTRFYNFGEGKDNMTFDFKNSKIYDKLDGSLLKLDFHPEKGIWFVSTRKMAYAEGKNAFGTSYHELFMKCAGLDSDISSEDFTKYINSLIDDEDLFNHTIIFEMTSPESRIVKRYNEYMNYLIGIRSKISVENSYKDISKYINTFKFAKLPKMYSFSNEYEIKRSVHNLKDLDEGYICYNPETEARVKLKSPAYVAVHHMRSNGQLNLKRISELVYSQEHEEYLVYFNEDRVFFDPYIKAYDLMVKEVNEYFNIYNDIKDQKKFALSIIHIPFKWVLFSMRKGDSLEDVLMEASSQIKFDILNMFIDDKWKTQMNDSSKNKR